MNRLPPRLIAARPSSYRRVGDPASDFATAAQTLLSDLQSRGCQASRQQTVVNFQNAWNAVQQGTGVPNLLAVDGLYGAKTQAALQSWADANQAGAVPAGCVAAASSAPATSTSTTTTSSSTTTSNSLVSMLPPALQGSLLGAPVWLWALGGAVFVGAMYETRSRKPASTYRRARRRGKSRRLRRRRRNPDHYSHSDKATLAYIMSLPGVTRYRKKTRKKKKKSRR